MDADSQQDVRLSLCGSSKGEDSRGVGCGREAPSCGREWASFGGFRHLQLCWLPELEAPAGTVALGASHRDLGCLLS